MTAGVQWGRCSVWSGLGSELDGACFIFSLVSSWIILMQALEGDSQWGVFETPAGRGGPGSLQGQEGLQ